MIAAALLLQAAAPQSAVDAERAFAAAAQARGQWTAFRDYAAADAVMFVPQPINAQAWMKDRKDPPKSVEWWPTESYVSCDGNVAVNTGGWKRPDGSVGYFTTVWRRQPDGAWKWYMDHGDGLATARPQPVEPEVRQASCDSKPAEIAFDGCHGIRPDCTDIQSDDRTLVWSWRVKRDGARTFRAELWDGKRFVKVIDNGVAPPK